MFARAACPLLTRPPNFRDFHTTVSRLHRRRTVCLFLACGPRAIREVMRWSPLCLQLWDSSSCRRGRWANFLPDGEIILTFARLLESKRLTTSSSLTCRNTISKPRSRPRPSSTPDLLSTSLPPLPLITGRSPGPSPPRRRLRSTTTSPHPMRPVSSRRRTMPNSTRRTDMPSRPTSSGSATRWRRAAAGWAGWGTVWTMRISGG